MNQLGKDLLIQKKGRAPINVSKTHEIKVNRNAERINIFVFLLNINETLRPVNKQTIDITKKQPNLIHHKRNQQPGNKRINEKK